MLYPVKYAPKSLKEVHGQGLATPLIREFVVNFASQKKKALLLYGPPGTGKTCSAYALANELNLEIMETNASDFRDEKKLASTVGQALKQQSLFAKSKIILVDEIDGLFSQLDRGAVPALVALIKNSAYPIIMTVNDPWNKKFSALRTACRLVELKAIDTQACISLLREICEKEAIKYDEKALSMLARHSGGDARGMLIDLQSIISDNLLTAEKVELLSDRHQTETIFNVIMRIFKTTDAFVARTAFEDLNEDLDMISLWIDENLPKEYTKPADIYRAYEKLSRADVFKGRIHRRQHWHFLAIINILLSAGISLSKDAKYNTFTRYSQPMRLLKIWQANQRNAKRKSIAGKIGAKTHCSTKRALHSTFPYFRLIYSKQPAIAQHLHLTGEEVEWLAK